MAGRRHLARADIGRYAAGQPRPGLPEAIANLQCLCRSLDGLQQRDAAFMEVPPRFCVA